VRSQLNVRTLGALPNYEVFLGRIVLQIEIHDAELRAEMQDGDLLLVFDPVFVHHWERLAGRVEGVGRWQRAQMRVSRGRWLAPPLAETTLLQGGWLQVGEERFDSLIPFPLEATGTVSGYLVPRDNSPLSLEFAGAAVILELTGEPRGAERLPVEWAPSNLI
jgi:hypothetical protein